MEEDEAHSHPYFGWSSFDNSKINLEMDEDAVMMTPEHFSPRLDPCEEAEREAEEDDEEEIFQELT